MVKRYHCVMNGMEDFDLGDYVEHTDYEKLELEKEAAEKLCEIYFNIAAGVLGEDVVRKLRDKQL